MKKTRRLWSETKPTVNTFVGHGKRTKAFSNFLNGVAFHQIVFLQILLLSVKSGQVFFTLYTRQEVD